MNNFVRSETYARARLVSGTIMIVLGAMLLVGMFRQAGFDWKGLPATSSASR